MIRMLDIVSDLLVCGYGFVFLWIFHIFLKIRKNWILRILALLAAILLADQYIYANDLPGILGLFLGFLAFVAVFFQGRWIHRLTAVMIFYPTEIAVNYLMLNMGSRLFFWWTNAPAESDLGWTSEQWLISTAIHTVSLAIRLAFWVGSWAFLRKYLTKITSNLTTRMWGILDVLMLAPCVAIFIIIYFMQEEMYIMYPICIASVFSFYGCIYMAAYISDSMRTAYHAQELEMKQTYYQERMKDEERVRRVYHDMKNHLLVLQAQSGRSEEINASIRTLQAQIEGYETYHHTGNDYLDIIIRDKARLAREKQIDFNAVIRFGDGSFLEPVDISTIFGNGLDNAIEASEKMPEGMRLITVKASRIRDMMVITVENNMQSSIWKDGKTTKEDDFLHGFGISNIKQAAEKYDGACIVKALEDRFVLKVVLPIPA